MSSLPNSTQEKHFRTLEWAKKILVKSPTAKEIKAKIDKWY
jgi:hypothetical protein